MAVRWMFGLVLSSLLEDHNDDATLPQSLLLRKNSSRIGSEVTSEVTSDLQDLGLDSLGATALLNTYKSATSKKPES